MLMSKCNKLWPLYNLAGVPLLYELICVGLYLTSGYIAFITGFLLTHGLVDIYAT